MTIVEYHTTLTWRYLYKKYRKDELVRIQHRFAKQLRDAGITENPDKTKIAVVFWEDIDGDDPSNTKSVIAGNIMHQIDWLDKLDLDWSLLY